MFRLVLFAALSLCPLVSVAQSADSLTIGFNGTDADKQIPHNEIFWKFQAEHAPSAPSQKLCHTYVSYDVADEDTGTQGGLRWLEDWLKAENGHCDQALLSFKWIDGVSNQSSATRSNSAPPSPAQYKVEMDHFLAKAAQWKASGVFSGDLAYTPWNEPNNAAKSGDGLGTSPIAPRLAADYYLILRILCGKNCTVAAGDFASNGQMGFDMVQHCKVDEGADLCKDASYIDIYKHFIDADASIVGFKSPHRPEVWAYHAWDDVNNFIHGNNKCTSDTNVTTCTTQAFLHAIDGSWANSKVWSDETGVGQPGITAPDDKTQAQAAAFLLTLTAKQPRITRIYLTKAFYGAKNPDNLWGSLFGTGGKPRPALCVLAARQTTYPSTVCP